jgi:hypothetical protein
MRSPLKIVIGNASLAQYPEGGGLWSCFLQHLFGLQALGHEVSWLEILRRSGNPTTDDARVRLFLERMAACGLDGRCMVLVCDPGAPALPEICDLRGMSAAAAARRIADADLLWNFSCAVREPLLGRFRRRALIDGDPGEIQVSALTNDLGIDGHDVLFTAGLNVGSPNGRTPTLGREWIPFPQFVHLSLWSITAPPPGAPFTSITQWFWRELWWNSEVLETGKRAAYLHVLDLPRRTAHPIELAVNLHPDDQTGDRELLLDHGWRLASPHDRAGSPEQYRSYIAASRGELCCPKPIHCQLRTGWFSDRSAAFLASGRPVIARRTGFEDHLPTGTGIVTFEGVEEAACALDEVAGNYGTHARAARAFAEGHLSAADVLRAMLERCA